MECVNGWSQLDAAPNHGRRALLTAVCNAGPALGIAGIISGPIRIRVIF